MGCGNSKKQLTAVREDTNGKPAIKDGWVKQHSKSSIKNIDDVVSVNGNESESDVEDGVEFITKPLLYQPLPPPKFPNLRDIERNADQDVVCLRTAIPHPAKLPKLRESRTRNEPVSMLGKELVNGQHRFEPQLITSPRQYDSEPPVKPPRLKREVAIPPPEYFQAIDNHALKAPEMFHSSVNNLARYLVQPARNDVEKVRALFRWITHNIRYDTKIFSKKGLAGPQDADSVLKRRSAVCEGYSNLFLKLCGEVEIPCKKISGLSKAFRYDPETRFNTDSDTDHAWNIVFVNSDWWPIDVTWAAGSVDKDTYKFNQCFTELYFLTDPKDFVIKHFPYVNKNYEESRRFQLLANPLTIEEFDLAIAPHHRGIEWGFQSPAYRQVVDFDKVCEIQILTTKLKMMDISCSFKDSKTGKDFTDYVLLRKLPDGTFTAKLTPPVTGKFELTLYGKVELSDTENKSLMTYIIRCHSVMKNVVPYPKHSGTWGVKIPYILYGFQPDIGDIDVVTATAGRAEIKCKVSRDVNVSFQLQHSQDTDQCYDQFYMAFIEKGILTVKFRFPVSGFFRFRVFAKNMQNMQNTLDYTGDILIKSKDAHSDRQPYPKGQGILGLKSDIKNYGIVSTSHTGEEVASENGETEMRFRVKKDIRVSFKLEHAETTRNDLNRLLMAYIEDEHLIVKIRLPILGYYNLTMFAQNIVENKPSNDFIGKFLLSCSDPCMDQRPYPEHWGVWGAKPVVTEYGFTSEIFNHTYLTATNGEVSMSLPVTPSVSLSFRLSHAMEDIPDIGRYVFSQVKSDMLYVDVRLPRAGFYKLTVFGRHPDNGTFGELDPIADILLESKTDIRNLQPYPVVYSKASEYGFTLLQPLNGDLPANQNVRIRMTSELGMRIMVNKQVYRKGENNEFDVTFMTAGLHETVTIYGSSEDSGSLDGIYQFTCSKQNWFL